MLSHDDREVLALLFLPVLLVASVLVTHQSLRTLHNYVASIPLPDQEIASLPPTSQERTPAAPIGRAVARAVSSAPIVALAREKAPAARSVGESPPPVTAAPPEKSAAVPAVEPLATPAPVPRALVPASDPAAIPPAAGELEMALLGPMPDLLGTPPIVPDPLTGYEADDAGRPVHAGICRIEDSQKAATPVSFEPVPADSESFGLRLAEAAEAQVGSFVIYNDAYRAIRFPMGDVNRFFGVCTDVVVRAYRSLGLDLQALVQQARAGRGDKNIDHRRTEVLKRFFTREGQSLPITAFPEDYRPGDIVTYYRPQNQRSRAHIAIVSNVIAPSGRPMIVHNRGWGPQLEDALFVDEITGHYRYAGPGQTRNAAMDRRKQAPAAPVIPASFSVTPAAADLRAE